MSIKKKIRVKGNKQATTAISITQGPTKEAVGDTLAAIAAIIKDSKDAGVLIKALDVLDHATQTQPVTVSDCDFNMES